MLVCKRIRSGPVVLPVVLVCDEGPGIGLGHRRRCEAIATELRALGFAPAIVTSGRGIIAAPVVVVDSYKFRADDRARFVPDVVVAIDDLHRDLDVDVLVCPAPTAHAMGAFDITARRVLLAGSRYCVIDPALARVPAAAITERVETILVTMGAADAMGLGAEIAGDLARRLPDAEIKLVIGPWGSQTVPAGVVAVCAPKSLASELANADVVVTAGGVTLLEALALGRPTIAIATADNQLDNVAACAAAGAAISCDVAGVSAQVSVLCGDSDTRHRLSNAARALVDGRGAQRVAAAIAKRAAISCGVAL